MFNYDDLLQGKGTYVIAEIGANHNGDIDLAKQMIDVAIDCGADCVKFQSWSKDSIFSKKVYKDNYFLRDDYRNRKDYTLESIVEKYSIDKNDHIELKEYCDLKGIDFASTAFSCRRAQRPLHQGRFNGCNEYSSARTCGRKAETGCHKHWPMWSYGD
jgi:N-acetylneuraminate synthase